MSSLTQKDARTLVNASTLYYIEGKSQQEIAELIGVSRPQVSRILQTAKDQGIITFSVHDPYSEEHMLEKQLVRRFGLLDAVVVDTKGELISQDMADEVTALLNAAIKDGDTFAVMGGNTIASLSMRVGKISCRNTRIAPMVGGVSVTGSSFNANDCARLFSKKLSCEYYQLNAPSFASSKELADSIQREPMIERVIDVARGASTALITVASLYQSSSAAPDPTFQEITIDALRAHGAVAALGSAFIDSSGQRVEFDGMTRFIGLQAEELRNIPKVIAIAVGAHKVDAIHAMLCGKWTDILVTNMATAQLVLKK